MPFSHHSHSGQFCMHAAQGESLEDMVRTAIARGLRVFALTEHAPRDMQEDLYPEEVAAQKTTFDLYQSFSEYYGQACQLRDKYSGQIHLLIGLEAEYIRPKSIDLAKHLRKKYNFDFTVGSVHHVNTIPIDFDKAFYLRALESIGSEEGLFAAYFDTQYLMLQALKPAVVAHFDLIRLFANDPEKDLMHYGEEVWNKVVRNILYIIDYGGLLELNSASLMKGWPTPYPRQDVCTTFIYHRGRFTLSDDAHSMAQVGLNYLRVYEYMQNLGITHIHYLEKLPMGEIAFNMQEACTVRQMSLTALVREPFWAKLTAASPPTSV